MMETYKPLTIVFKFTGSGSDDSPETMKLNECICLHLRHTIWCSVMAEGNILLESHLQRNEWANTDACILEEDMADIQEELEAPGAADTVQEQAKFVRKASP